MQNHELAAVVLVREGDVPDLEGTLVQVREQCGVRLAVVVVDQTHAGHLVRRAAELGAVVVREPSPSRGLALVRAAEAVEAEAYLLFEPRTRSAPDRAARQWARLAGDASVHLVTCDLALADGRGPAVQRRSVDLAVDAPPGLWHAGLCVRRALLATVERAAFAPSELGLLAAARGSGAWAHESEALVTVDADASAAHADVVRLDAELLRLSALAPLAEPEVTVLLATHDRCDTLLDCLAGFARQLVRPGTLEVVVVDDASSDATPLVLPRVELRQRLVALRLDRPSGASAARNAGLPHARGRLVLFVNDDTIPAPDLVLRHLEAHRELGPGAMVLGSFRQGPKVLDNALNRVLDDSHLVFGYAGFVPGQELEGGHFYTCNASVALDAVRAVGPFDEGYAACGGEDTDYGLRLVDAGQRLYFRPECRAEHRHRLSFDDFVRRQRRVARAHVRLYLDHPELVEGQPWADRTVAYLEQGLRQAAAVVPACERSARSLAELDLGAIARGGPAAAATADRLRATLDDQVRRLHNLYWTEGLVAGLVEHGLDGFGALLERARARRTIARVESGAPLEEVNHRA